MTAENNFLDRLDLAETLSIKHDVDGESVVAQVAHRGDFPTRELLRRLDIPDPIERSRTVKAIFDARRALGVFAEI